ncbi:helix-turn-helix domain-containing protein [Enterococcus sp. AZ196]|uniref:helix-turn-helix domain-containing protein n=1 Tax=Enterococcus sp. AZ196 TaxID=2774659 RepID=UPI003D2A4600
MEFGVKVRELRMKKGFSQKEIYTGIISKSYAIEFEKGRHSLSSLLLIEVLDRLSMDIDEFLFINRGYLLNPYADYIYRLSKYSNSHDLGNLKLLLEELSSHNDIVSKVRQAEVRCRINMIDSILSTGSFRPDVILKEDRDLIQDYLMEIETWTLQEVQLFGNTIEFLNFEKHLPLFKNLSKSLTLYIEYDKGREIFCAMLLNLIVQAIKNDYLDYAEVLTVQLKMLSSEYKEFFHRVVADFFSNIIELKKGGSFESKLKAQKYLDLISSLGQKAIATELSYLLHNE